MAFLMLTANMPSKMVFAEEQLVGAIPSGAKEANVPASEVDYESIYSGAVENVKAEVEQEGADYDWLEYALYDMDQDGYLELLIQNGTCNADMTYEIYTTDGSECYYLGKEVGMAQAIFADPEEHSFYTYFGRQWVVTIYKVTMKDGKIESEVYFNGNDENYENEYPVLKKQIKTHTLNEGMIWEASEVVDADAEGEYVFPNSDTEYLSYEEVSAKSDEELLWGRNEIYARHGYIFQDESIRQHFENTDWYQGTVSSDQFDTSVFNDYELSNIDLIVQVESERNGEADSNDDYAEYPDFSGVYIDGTGEEYNRLEITQNGNLVSFDWYCGDEYQTSEYDLPISEMGTVDIGGGGFWKTDENTLKYSPGSGGSSMTRTFWKVG